MKEKEISRNKRRRRVRKKIMGTHERPRLSVFRSNRHMYSQLIDDIKGCTLISVSTMEKSLREDLKSFSPIETAKKVGKLLAERALTLKFQKVVFDRGGNLFHGRVKAVAEGAREGGLVF
ncbi:MAG TPA: 50S ribosomal protein L18 [Nitrospiria bacterium]|jgi:large subunit ribosomal protein L18